MTDEEREQVCNVLNAICKDKPWLNSNVNPDNVPYIPKNKFASYFFNINRDSSAIYEIPQSIEVSDGALDALKSIYYHVGYVFTRGKGEKLLEHNGRLIWEYLIYGKRKFVTIDKAQFPQFAKVWLPIAEWKGDESSC